MHQHTTCFGTNLGRAETWRVYRIRTANSTYQLEVAASLLKMVCHRRDLAAALRDEPLLARRLKMALAACGLMLETLEARDPGA